MTTDTPLPGAPDGELDRLRRRVRELEQLVTRLTEATTDARHREMTWLYALEGNQDGVWDWNIVTGEVFFSARWKAMLGYEDAEITGNLAEWDSRVHPDDRDAAYADIQRHIDGLAPVYRNEHRVRCKDGSYKWILDRGRVVAWMPDGKPLRMVGTHTDITERKEAELARATSTTAGAGNR